MRSDDVLSQLRIESEDVDNITKQTAFEHLTARMQIDTSEPSTQLAARHGRTRRRWTIPMIPAATSLVALAAVAIAVPALWPDGHPGAPANAAAATVQRLAATAATQDGAVVPDGQYWHTTRIERSAHHVGGGEHDYTYSIAERVQNWTRSGSVLIEQREPYGEPTFPTAADKSNWAASGSPKLDGNENATTGIIGGIDGYRVGSGPALSYEEIRALPTESDKLEKFIDERVGDDSLGARIRVYEDLLVGAPTTPGTRATLIRSLHDVKGLRVDGDATDASGRSGIKLSAPDRQVDGDHRLALVFDKANSQLLQFEDAEPGKASALYQVTNVSSEASASAPSVEGIPQVNVING